MYLTTKRKVIDCFSHVLHYDKTIGLVSSFNYWGHSPNANPYPKPKPNPKLKPQRYSL